MNQASTNEREVIAALDIGSNSFHLIVARIVDGSLQTLHKVKQRVRLAQGLSADGTLNQAAIDRAKDTLKQMAQTLQDVPESNVRVVATYTLRKAKNVQDFLNQVESVFPYPIEIIPGKEEARLIYQGIAHTVAGDDNRLVVDIGGGSTEFIIGHHFTPLKLNSRSMGCVSFTEQYFPQGKITERHFQKAILAAEQELEHIADEYKAVGWKQAHGTSGTIKAIREAIIQNGWSDGDIHAKHLEKLKQTLITFENINNINIPGVSEHRRPVLAGGLAVLIAAFDSLNIRSMRYEDAALREGVLYEMEDRFQHEDIRERTVESLSQRYAIDTQQAARVHTSANYIFEQVANEWQLNKKDFQQLLGWAAQLHEVGLHIHSTGYHKHSAYILEHTDMPGFNVEQQQAVATLVRYHRKKLKPTELTNFNYYKTQKILRLVRILRIATMLNLRRIEGYLPKYKVAVTNEALSIDFPKAFLQQHPLLEADLMTEATMQTDAGFEFTFS
ncbi:exopolyphosphatase [Catenovulum agarivorans DS-2]|uniref:Exopolyphosphatase n=1 Tax=Catenovulum agarivorans DS-2 TaxID=1328313 RepID=W7QNP3_9ALTE|nr:exopolyphosphatase [Catenovulum agarivorans]EWH09548.1 exopolyphosphatase [Catenovulum agarivorans DS-2]